MTANRRQKLVAELRQLTASIKPMKELISQVEDLGVLLEFAEADDSGNSEAELKQALTAIGPKLDAVELQATMADPERRLRRVRRHSSGRRGDRLGRLGRNAAADVPALGRDQGL